VTQAEDDLFAPSRAQMWRMLGVFGLIAAFVLALAVWFSVRLAAPPVGKDTHITEHPRCQDRGGRRVAQARRAAAWRVAAIQLTYPPEVL